jgi:archaellum component FlaG (FlaF/FlaG flagellin family)
MWRTILLSLGVLLALTVTPAAADPVNNPRAPTFTVTCIVDGQSTTFHVIGTGAAGHVLEDNSVAVIMSGTLTTFVNGVQTEQVTFPPVPGEGLRTVPCTATAEFEDEEGNLVRIELTDAQLLLTPPRR